MDPVLQKIQTDLSRDQSLRKNLIAQLEKDLNSSFLKAEDELQTICLKLEKLLEKHQEEWIPWLYRVDVKENHIQALQEKAFGLSELALLILRREMEKVIFRKQYNG